jgi:integrase
LSFVGVILLWDRNYFSQDTSTVSSPSAAVGYGIGIFMTPQLAETLKDLKLIQKKKAIKRGKPFPDHVFANNRGEIFLGVPFENALNRCLTAAKLRRIRIHDLRHTYANIRISRGHNIGDVSKQLGHSSIKITFDVYGHLQPGHFKSEIDELDTPRTAPLQNAEIGCV